MGAPLFASAIGCLLSFSFASALDRFCGRERDGWICWDSFQLRATLERIPEPAPLYIPFELRFMSLEV